MGSWRPVLLHQRSRSCELAARWDSVRSVDAPRSARRRSNRRAAGCFAMGQRHINASDFRDRGLQTTLACLPPASAQRGDMWRLQHRLKTPQHPPRNASADYMTLRSLRIGTRTISHGHQHRQRACQEGLTHARADIMLQILNPLFGGGAARTSSSALDRQSSPVCPTVIDESARRAVKNAARLAS